MPIQLLNHLSLAQKIWSGVFIFCLLLLVLVTIMLRSQTQVSESMRRVLGHDMELLTTTAHLDSDIKEHAGALGLFLLTRNPAYRQQLATNKTHLDQELAQLHELVAGGNPALVQRLERIGELLRRLATAEQKVVAVAADSMLTMPGLAYARDNVAPHGLEATTALKNMQQTMVAEGVDEQNLPLLVQVNDMLYNLVRLSASIRAYLSFRTPEQVDNVHAFLESLLERIDGLLQAGDLELDQEDALNGAREHLALYRKNFEQLLSIHGGEGWRQDSYLVRRLVAPVERQLAGELGDFVGEIRASTQRAAEALEASLDRQASFTLILAGSGIGLGVLVMWAIIGLVKSRLQDAVSALRAVAESGNLSQRLDDGGRDEVSQLAGYFNAFVAKIKGVVDLVIAASSSLAAEAERMNEATTASQQQVTRQQQDIGEIAGAADQVADAAKQVKQSADAAAEATANAHQHAQEGQAMVQEVVASVQTLAQEVQEAAGVIARVEDGSEQIGVVLSVIRTISEQTNLLALNAAIEAARAGEHGRGFAVVADEVRTLSEKIHAETDQIQEIIDTLQERSREAVQVMTRGTERSSAVAGKAESAGSALAGIASSVATISDMNQNIARLSGNQLERVQEVRSRIVSIRGIAEEAADTSAQAARSAHEFTLMAMQLQDLVRQFLSEEHEAVAAPAEAPPPAALESEGDVELF